MDKLDLISGFQINLMINKSDNIKTKFGGFLAIILAFLSILCVIGFGWDLVYKENPVVYSSNQMGEDLRLERHRFQAAVAPMYTGGVTIPDIERMITIKTQYAVTDGESTNFTFYETKKCMNEESLKVNNTFDSMKSAFIADDSNYYCLSEDMKFDLENTYGNSKFAIWKIEIHYCTNSTENHNHCYSREYTQDALQEFFIHFIWSSYYIDSSDFNEPAKFTYDNMLIRLSALASRQDIFYYKLFDYFSDNGFIMESNNLHQGFYINKHDTDSVQDSNTQKIERIYFTLDKYKEKIQRNYVKIQKVAADIGGILKFFTFIFGFVSWNYGRFAFYDFLINFFIKEVDKAQVFLDSSNQNPISNQNIQVNKTEKDKKNENNNESESKIEISRFKNNNYSQYSSEMPKLQLKLASVVGKPTPNSNSNGVKIKKENSIEKEKEKINTKLDYYHSNYNIIRYYCCRNNNNTKHLVKIRQYYEENFSVENFLKNDYETLEFKNKFITPEHKKEINDLAVKKQFNFLFKELAYED